MGQMFLVIVDAYSKYLDIVPMVHATTKGVLYALRQTFAIFGLPEHLVTDNGSQFTNEDFAHFLKVNGIHHTRTAPGHLATNGLTERYVGHFKSKMKLINLDKGLEDLNTKLCQFLLSYRTTPTKNGKSPAELMFGRQPRTRYDILKPSETQERVKVFEQSLASPPEFNVGRPVYVLNFGNHGSKWVPAVILSCVSVYNYKVKVNNFIWKQHRNQIRQRVVAEESPVPTDSVASDAERQHLPKQHLVARVIDQEEEDQTSAANRASDEMTRSHDIREESEEAQEPDTSRMITPTSCELRRSSRQRQKPNRLVESPE